MSPYPYPNLVKIVVAAMALYSFIIKQGLEDEILQASNDECFCVNESGFHNEEQEEETVTPDNNELGILRDRIYDDIIASRGC